MYNVKMELELGATLDERISLCELKQFLSPVECMQLLNLAHDIGYHTSTVITEKGYTHHPKRTSSSCALRKGHTPLVRHIEELAMQLTGCKYDDIEPLQIVKYTEGQEYDTHFDYFDEKVAASEIAERGQRWVTILVYLLTPFEGGETYFPRLGVSVKPCLGDAVMWKNCNDDGLGNYTVCPLSEHGGLPVIRGAKVALNIWIRRKM